MKRLRALFVRVGGLWPNAHREQELSDEIEEHLRMHIDDNLGSGMSAVEARRIALIKLGGVERVKEAYREGKTVSFLEQAGQDIRFASRQLVAHPGFSVTAILILALGLCASLGIFAFVDAALIKPLPYRSSARLVGVYEHIPLCPLCNLSYPDYLDWKRLNNVFTSLEIYQHTGFSLTLASGAEAARGARVSDGFFRALGVAPIIGRDFRAGEDQPSAPRTVLLSYAAWQRRYGGNPNVLGTAVKLNGEANLVIGILPPDFHFAPAEPAEFWTAFHAKSECDLRRSCHSLYGVARLKDGVSREAALANLAGIAKQLEKQYPDSNHGQGAAVVALSEVIVGNIRTILLVLLGGAGLLLLIAATNVASLLLVRSETRKKEMAVRSALGASRSRLIRQFVTEGAVLVAAGSTFGIAAAYGVVQLLMSLIPVDMAAHMPYLRSLGLNVRVLVFAGVICLLAALLFTLTPVLHLALSSVREGLTEGSRGSAGNTWRRIGPKLVVLELATAMVLLAGAGLLGKSLHRLLHVELGMHPDHLALFDISAPLAIYANDASLVALGRAVLAQLRALPGVSLAGLTTVPPVSGNGNTDWIRFLGRPFHGEHNEVNGRQVSAAYFSTLQAKLLRGRYFTDAEDGSKPRVAIINQALAKKYFAGEDPIGKKIGDTALSPKSMKEIIGIVDDIREGALDDETWPTAYYPFNQSPDTYFSAIVRTPQPEQILPAMTNSVRQLNRGIVTSSGVSLNQMIRDSQAAYLHRSSAWLVGSFAALALLLGVIGLYGVIAYSVSQRTREIGVRIALGASTKSVYELVLREAGWLTGIGIVVGLFGSFAAATLMKSLLFGVRSWDIPTLALVALVLGGAASAASYIPARRAARVNPVDALRAE